MKPLARALPLVFGLALAGCEGFLYCTDMGCGNTLNVQLVGLPDGDYMLLLEAPGEEPTQLDCSVPHGCFGPVDQEFTPDEVTITLEWNDSTIVRHFELDYETSRPNGRFCGPVCRQADVVFEVDG